MQTEIMQTEMLLPGDDDDDENWDHLAGGELRRPTIEELNPLVHGEAPWAGVVL